MYAYGKHLGLAFQVVDDILDFTQSSEKLGKPQGQDLASGNLTAPAIYALQVRGWAAGRQCLPAGLHGCMQACRLVPAAAAAAALQTPRLTAPPPTPPHPTAPLQDEMVGDSLLQLIRGRFTEEGSLERALELVSLGGGIDK